MDLPCQVRGIQPKLTSSYREKAYKVETFCPPPKISISKCQQSLPVLHSESARGRLLTAQDNRQTPGPAHANRTGGPHLLRVAGGGQDRRSKVSELA